MNKPEPLKDLFDLSTGDKVYLGTDHFGKLIFRPATVLRHTDHFMTFVDKNGHENRFRLATGTAICGIKWEGGTSVYRCTAEVREYRRLPRNYNPTSSGRG